MLTGATAVFLGGCGAPTDHPLTTPPAPAAPTRLPPGPLPAPGAPGTDRVEGVIRAVSDDTIRLTQRDRSAAVVAFTSSTRIVETTPARLTDVTVGSCVDVTPAANGAPAGAAITAQFVMIGAPVGGTCPGPPTAAASAEKPGLSGTVAAVSGTTITVAHAEAGGRNTQTAVTVTTATGYARQAPATAQAIVAGKCLAAQGTTGGGVLHAMSIDLRPCPPLGGHRHHAPHFRRG